MEMNTQVTKKEKDKISKFGVPNTLRCKFALELLNILLQCVQKNLFVFF
jgi:hypothetical protein